MNHVLFGVEEVIGMITAGKSLLLAGDEALLNQLPHGSWIGGTIPYFMGEKGGEFTKSKIHVTTLPESASNHSIRFYDENSIENIYSDAPEQGFSVVIMPAASKTHQTFSLKAPMFSHFASSPLIGWISGVDLKDLGKITPKVFDGKTGRISDNGAVVMHASLPKEKAAIVGIINIFEQGGGDTLTFDRDGFSASEVMVNGKKQSLVDYLLVNKIDTRLPLVADSYGAMVNTSFQLVDEAGNRVDFYAPVFKGVEYKLAKPVLNYVESFEKIAGAKLGDQIIFACNCILNYLYSELEGKKTGNVTGPVTFGEVAYQLLNQTMAYMTIESI
ncbi:MAG: DUF6976 family protein [Spirochaetia bacterium]